MLRTSQDVSRLVDLCRQTIIFDDPLDLAACLLAIRSDPETRLLRVKNRLDPDYDTRLSAGYRDVALNLRLVGSEAVAMGLDTHVCEVLLLLRSMYELKVLHAHFGGLRKGRRLC